MNERKVHNSAAVEETAARPHQLERANPMARTLDKYILTILKGTPARILRRVREPEEALPANLGCDDFNYLLR